MFWVLSYVIQPPNVISSPVGSSIMYCEVACRLKESRQLSHNFFEMPGGDTQYEQSPPLKLRLKIVQNCQGVGSFAPEACWALIKEQKVFVL